MNRMVCVVLTLTALLATGCASTYSSIRKVDDNTYVLTRTQHGFFQTSGSIFSCVPVGDNLKCTEIDNL